MTLNCSQKRVDPLRKVACVSADLARAAVRHNLWMVEANFRSLKIAFFVENDCRPLSE